MRMMEKVMNSDVDIVGEDREMVMKLAEYEIIFYDPVDRRVKYPTRLDEKAVKELLQSPCIDFISAVVG